MENFIDKQPTFNTIISNIINNDKSVHAYILVSEDDELLKLASFLLAKVTICPSKYDLACAKCNICKRIDNGDYTDLKIINPVNNIIKKQEILDLRDSFQTRAIEGKNKVYIINHAEYLGASAANSMLKFLEEPEGDVVGIFTTNNLSMVLETIKSRCQVIKLNNNTLEEGVDYVKKYCNCNDDIINLALDFVALLEKNKAKIVTSELNKLLTTLDSKEKIIAFMNVILLVYFDKLNNIVLNKTKYFIDNDKFDKIQVDNKERIIKKTIFILENIEKTNYNVNNLLFFSNFVIGMGEIDNDKGNRSQI